MPKLQTFIAYDHDMNLGRAYNESMAMLPEDGWGCFLDHDASFTTLDWHKLICRAIDAHPEAGMLSAFTNRVGNKTQVVNVPGCADNHDMRDHRKLGRQFADIEGTNVTDADPISGVVIIVSKTCWRDAGKFKEGFFLGVDNQMHYDVRRAGYRILLLKGLYVYHWYRADGERAHLDNAPRLWPLRE